MSAPISATSSVHTIQPSCALFQLPCVHNQNPIQTGSQGQQPQAPIIMLGESHSKGTMLKRKGQLGMERVLTSARRKGRAIQPPQHRSCPSSCQIHHRRSAGRMHHHPKLCKSTAIVPQLPKTMCYMQNARDTAAPCCSASQRVQALTFTEQQRCYSLLSGNLPHHPVCQRRLVVVLLWQAERPPVRLFWRELQLLHVLHTAAI